MSMYINTTSCCGVHELSSIHGHWISQTDPNKEGPISFMEGLKTNLFRPIDYWMYNPATKKQENYPQERQFSCRCAFFIFTDHHAAISNHTKKLIPYGKSLAKYILKNKLGRLSCSRPAVNPNSRNKVTVWVWEIDRDALENHLNVLFPWTPAKLPHGVSPPKKWRVGDRVRLTDNNNGFGEVGAEGVVISEGKHRTGPRVRFDKVFNGSREWNAYDNARNECNLELVAAAPDVSDHPERVV